MVAKLEQPPITATVDGKGGLLIQSSRAAVRIYPSETSGGGLYFEVAVERGKRGVVIANERGRSYLCTVGGADE